MRRRDRPQTWGLWGAFDPVVPRDLRLEVAERMLADGTVHKELDVGAVRAAAETLAARDTAVARARSEIARSLEVTIESLVRLEARGDGEAALGALAHQLSSTSLRGVRTEAVWRAADGETHALVALDLDRVQATLRSSPTLPARSRESLAERAAAAFAAMDAAFEAPDGVPAPTPAPADR